MMKEDIDYVVKEIRAQYEEKGTEEKKIDRLCRLDAKVKRPAKTAAYVFGTVGSLVMGTGMCLAMDVLGEKKRVPGILIGLAGMGMMAVNYPAYKKRLALRKKKYANRILDLSEEIMSEDL